MWLHKRYNGDDLVLLGDFSGNRLHYKLMVKKALLVILRSKKTCGAKAGLESLGISHGTLS